MDASQKDSGSSTEDAGSMAKDAGPTDSGMPGPACDGGLSACDDSCIDLTQAVENCGRCGRKCTSGVCNQGMCDPFVVRDQSNTEAGMGTPIPAYAVADPFVFYVPASGSTTIQRVPVTGGTPKEVTYTAPSTISQLVSDPDGYLYAAHSDQDNGGPNSVSRMNPLLVDHFDPVAGGQITTYIIKLTTNATHVVIVSTLSRYYIQSVPKTGGTEFKLIASGPSMEEVEVDSDSAFIRDEGAIIRTSVADGGDAKVVVTMDNGEQAKDIALSADKVVFASNTRVAAAPKQGGDAKPLAQHSAYAVVADDTRAYFLHSHDDSADCTAGTDIYSVALDGTDERMLATSPCNVASCCLGRLTQDGTALYMQTADSTKILRVEK